jgi:hypothetical protein
MPTRRLIQLTFLLLLFAGTIYSQWTPVTRTPGGAVCAVQVIGDTLIAGLAGEAWGTPLTGVYRSTDSGESWHLMGLGEIPVVSLARSGPYILAGTWYSGIYRSSDGGKTWEQRLSDRIIGPLIADDSIVYAGTNGSGVAHSLDRGVTWVMGTPNTWAMEGLAVAGPYVFALQTSSYPFLIRATRPPSGWQQLPSPADSTDFIQLAGADSVLFISTHHGLFMSKDYGGSWTLSNVGLPNGRVVTAFCVLEEGIVALVGGDLYRSTDLGNSWQFLAQAPQDAALTAFAGKGSVLALGSSGAGVYVSTNQGMTWNDPGPGTGNAVSLLSRGQDLLLGEATGGVYRSSDNGEHWVSASVGMGSTGHCLLAGTPSTLLAAGSGFWCTYYNFYWVPRDLAMGVFRSSNEGTTWGQVMGGVDVSGWMVFAKDDWVFGRVGDCDMFGCSDDPYVSVDGGITWTTADTLLRSCQVFAATDSIIFAGGGPSPLARRTPIWSNTWGIFQSTDGGEMWERTPFPVRAVKALAASGPLAAAASWWTDTLTWVRHEDFQVSTDRGNSWHTVNAGIAGSGQSLLWIGEHLMAATSAGVFRFTMGDTVWCPINEGLEDSSVTSLVLHDENLFLVGSSGRVWRRPLSEVIASVEPLTDDLPHDFSLFQNSPNPFNPTTSIRYTLPGASLVVLDIYNILGQKVRGLVSEEQVAGEHLVSWDATNDAGRPIATGVYFYRLEARTADHRDYTMVKKMLLLR